MAVIMLHMNAITKRFPGVVANAGIDFDLRTGEIHALLGENGSGKSTLMSILAGLYRQDEGEIIFKGRRVDFRSPRDAIGAGIGMVHQHFKLVETFTVADNILLGDKRAAFFLNRSKSEASIEGLSARYGLQINPRAKIWQLSVGEKQRVEIVKMLYRGSEVLILDEPTAVLTPREAGELFNNLRRMTGGGRSVIVITHKLQEVMEIADRVTVLRAGRAVATLERDELSERKLAWLMVGRDVVVQHKKEPVRSSNIILDLYNVSALNDQSRPGLEDVSLNIRGGEILGMAGVAGNGQRELAEVIAGLRPVTRGAITIEGRDITNRTPREIIAAGVSHIPEDRLGTGLIPGLGAVDNLILKEYRQPSLARGPLIDWKRARADAERLVDRFNVLLTSLDAPVKFLSGGNLQKLLLAREISACPKLIVAVYPVRGLDIGAMQAVHQLLLEQRSRGAAILLISEDLDEIFKLSDRIGVLYEGRLTGFLPAEHADLEEIGLLMMGSKWTDDMEEQPNDISSTARVTHLL